MVRAEERPSGLGLPDETGPNQTIPNQANPNETNPGATSQDTGSPEVRWDGGRETGPDGGAAVKGLASRRHKSWESRWASGQVGIDNDQEVLAGRGEGWTVFSYLISGMLAYGGIGWLVGRAVHVQILFPIGMLVGLAISLGWIIYRYGLRR
jgi:hypothetical protein